MNRTSSGCTDTLRRLNAGLITKYVTRDNKNNKGKRRVMLNAKLRAKCYNKPIKLNGYINRTRHDTH